MLTLSYVKDAAAVHRLSVKFKKKTKQNLADTSIAGAVKHQIQKKGADT